MKNQSFFSPVKNSSKSGFTLIEIMVVVAIISILATVAIPNVLNSYMHSKQALARTTLKSISTALEHYTLKNGTYPSETTSLIGVPPYLNVDYFDGNHNSYTFSASLADYSYTVTANPVVTLSGATTYTITTGGVLSP